MSNDSTASNRDFKEFSVVISGEVAMTIRRIALSKNVSPSVVAREYLTDGMVAKRILPEWWHRGKMNAVK